MNTKTIFNYHYPPPFRCSPHIHLRRYPDGTLFIYRKTSGSVWHLCFLCGNLPTDECWKARRIETFKSQTIDRHGEFFVLGETVSPEEAIAIDGKYQSTHYFDRWGRVVQ